MTKIITSVQNASVKQAASLQLKKYRDETGLFLVEGEEFCDLAFHHDWEAEALFSSKPYKNSVQVTPEILEKISKKSNPQSVMGVFKQKKSNKLPTSVLKILPAMEEIRDPGNLGTILRTCYALGLKQIALIGQCCDPFAPETIRASMGAFAAVDVIEIDQHDLIDWAKKNPKMKLIGTDVVKATDYRQVDYQSSILLLGNEQKGLSPALKALCQQQAKIPMPGGAESLNVAMAATLLLYEAMRPSLR